MKGKTNLAPPVAGPTPMQADTFVRHARLGIDLGWTLRAVGVSLPHLRAWLDHCFAEVERVNAGKPATDPVLAMFGRMAEAGRLGKADLLASAQKAADEGDEEAKVFLRRHGKKLRAAIA